MRGGRFVPYDVRDEKERLRRRVLVQRGKLRPADLHAAAVALRDVLLSVPEVSRSAVVAAYVGVGTEPGTGPLLDALDRRGIRVLLPVMQRDFDLDWGAYTGPGGLAAAHFGLLEPVGPTLGRNAIATADAVLVPGLAADRSGMRLGRGGGSYDMVLPRIAPEAFSCVLLHEGELLEGAVPSDRRDWRVRAAALPSGLFRFPPPGTGAAAS
jgi:5-formyltetrahydrofolate cyclo-ligase